MQQNCAHIILYKCDYCCASLPSKPKLLEHFADRHFANKHNIMSELMKIKCPTCKERFLSKSKLAFHLKTKHKEFNCCHCNKQFRSSSGYSTHQKQCMAKQTFDKYSKYVTDADQKSDLFECKICKCNFIKMVYLMEHMEMVHSDKNSQFMTPTPISKPNCSICKESFSSRATLAQHDKRVHKDKRIFKCKKCKEEFVGKVFYRKHMRLSKCVNATQQYQCTVCSKIFTRNSNLRKHYNQHLTNKVYECDHCTKTFTLKSTLLLHLKKGNHQTIFQCEFCLRFLKKASALKTHLIYCKLRRKCS